MKTRKRWIVGPGNAYNDKTEGKYIKVEVGTSQVSSWCPTLLEQIKCSDWINIEDLVVGLAQENDWNRSLDQDFSGICLITVYSDGFSLERRLYNTFLSSFKVGHVSKQFLSLSSTIVKSKSERHLLPSCHLLSKWK